MFIHDSTRAQAKQPCVTNQSNNKKKETLNVFSCKETLALGFSFVLKPMF